MKRIFVSSLILLFLLVINLVVNNKSEPSPVKSADTTPIPLTLRNIPKSNKLVIDPEITATSVYILDLQSGVTLYQKNPDLLVPPASTTKIMTALAAIDNEAINNEVTIPFVKFSVIGQKMGLFRGETISFESLLYGLLVFSGNDAAEAIAQTYPGGRDAFIEVMNIKARKLGLKASVFKNPTGLDESGHLTTAREMATLGKFLMENSLLKSIVGTKNAVVSSVDLKFSHSLKSTNELLATVPGVVGIKTGWTEEARENLVTYVDRGHPIIISLFGSDDRFGETKTLIDWVYKNYSWE